MNCNLERQLLEKYCEGEADALERVVVENHIRLCPDCALAYAELEWISLSLRELGHSLEYPQELSELSVVMAETLTTRSSVPRTLVKVAENSSRFVKFIPGAAKAATLARKGICAAPKAVYGLTGYVVRGGARLAQAIT